MYTLALDSGWQIAFSTIANLIADIDSKNGSGSKLPDPQMSCQ
jgi:hypothetical protein